jgi:hypothetical protein
MKISPESHHTVAMQMPTQAQVVLVSQEICRCR